MRKKDTLVKILDVKVIPGQDLYDGWHNSMQQVTTDKGIFFDNYTQTNWITKKSQCMTVEIQEEITKTGKEILWIREKKTN